MKAVFTAVLVCFCLSCDNLSDKPKNKYSPAAKRLTHKVDSMAIQPPLGLSWGMNQANFRKEIEKRGGRHSYGENDLLDYDGVALGGDYVEAGGWFVGSQLYRVTIKTEMVFYGNLRNAVVSKYGAPNDSSKLFVYWSNKEGEIHMPAGYSDNVQAVEVSYQNNRLYNQKQSADSVNLKKDL